MQVKLQTKEGTSSTESIVHWQHLAKLTTKLKQKYSTNNVTIFMAQKLELP